jgi:hypothetical protein
MTKRVAERRRRWAPGASLRLIAARKQQDFAEAHVSALRLDPANHPSSFDHCKSRIVDLGARSRRRLDADIYATAKRVNAESLMS